MATKPAPSHLTHPCSDAWTSAISGSLPNGICVSSASDELAALSGPQSIAKVFFTRALNGHEILPKLQVLILSRDQVVVEEHN
jgi:hypothetical protein